MNRWSRRRQAEQALADAEQVRRDVEAELARTREAYDRALTESGVVLLQQVGPEVDGFHVSASMAQVLGWDPLAFLAPGILRGMVHPDDLATFAVAFPPPGSETLPPAPVIDLTDPADSTAPEATPAPTPSHDDLVVRFRTAAGHVGPRAAPPHRHPADAGFALARLAHRRQRRRGGPSHLAPLRRARRT